MNIINAIIIKLINAAMKFPIPNTPIFISAISSNPGTKIPIIGVIISWAKERISAFTARPIIKAEAKPRILYFLWNLKIPLLDASDPRDYNKESELSVEIKKTSFFDAYIFHKGI